MPFSLTSPSSLLNSLVLLPGHKKQGSSYLCFDYLHSLRPGHWAFSSKPEARAPWGRLPFNQGFRFEFLATSSSECNSIFKNFQKEDNRAWCTRSVPNFENFFPFNFAPRIGHLHQEVTWPMLPLTHSPLNRPCGSRSFLPFMTSSVLKVKDNFLR